MDTQDTFETKADQWREHWGNKYSTREKRAIFAELFDGIGINVWGQTLVDVGSGEDPVSHYFPGIAKVISIDLNGEEEEILYTLHLRLDIEEIANETSIAARSAIQKAATFLGLRTGKEACTEEQRRQVDMMVFSEVLNYVDYRKVLGACEKYLRPRGRFIILNQPMRGFDELFSEHGVKNNTSLVEYVESLGFKIEWKNMPSSSLENRNEMLMLIAKKS